jgi:DNA-damage-inducible protein D
MLGDRDIRPEELPPEEDIKKVERRLKSEENKPPESSRKIHKAVNTMFQSEKWLK